jgi:hypothetical protein
LGWHFEHFMSLRAQSTFDHVAAEKCGPFGQKPNGLPLGGQEFNWPSLYGHSAVQAQARASCTPARPGVPMKRLGYTRLGALGGGWGAIEPLGR